MAEEKRPGLTVREETDGRLRKLLVDYDGNVLLDETVFAYDDLIHFLDRPVKELRKQIHELKMHKLFEESLDVHVADLRDVVKRTIEITDTWKSGFPEAYFLTRKKLDNVLKTKDDHTAGVLLQVGWQSSRWNSLKARSRSGTSLQQKNKHEFPNTAISVCKKNTTKNKDWLVMQKSVTSQLLVMRLFIMRRDYRH